MTRDQPALVRCPHGGQEGDRPQELHGADGFGEHLGADSDQTGKDDIARAGVGDQGADQGEHRARQVGEALDRREGTGGQETRGGHLLHHEQGSVEDAADREGHAVSGQRRHRIGGAGQRRGEDGVGGGEEKAGSGQRGVEAGEAPRRDHLALTAHP